MFEAVWTRVHSFFVNLISDKKALMWRIVGFVATISVWTYLTSLPCALVLMVLILCHEYGHIWAMRRRGFNIKGVYFIVIGCAAIGGNEQKGVFGDRRDEAFIAIMGPLWGVVSTIVIATVYLLTGNAIWGAIALFNTVLNGFNLLPLASMDGGRIIRAISFSINKWLGMAVIVAGLAVFVWIVSAVNSPMWWFMGAFIVFIGLQELRYEFVTRNETTRIPMNAAKMTGYFTAYLGLIGFYYFVLRLLMSNSAVMEAIQQLTS